MSCLLFVPYFINKIEICIILLISRYGSRRSVRDLKSETSKGGKTRLYQILHTLHTTAIPTVCF